MVKNSIILLVAGGMLMLAGCMEMNPAFDPSLKTSQIEQKPDPTAVKRFQETNPNNPTAAESAIELSNKYAALTEEAGQLKMDKQNLLIENKQLAKQLTNIQTELNQAKKELAEANDLLIEMRIELNNWKADVLGFRDEMRKADKVQLETLVKILKVLGGEVDGNLSSELSSQGN